MWPQDRHLELGRPTHRNVLMRPSGRFLGASRLDLTSALRPLRNHPRSQRRTSLCLEAATCPPRGYPPPCADPESHKLGQHQGYPTDVRPPTTCFGSEHGRRQVSQGPCKVAPEPDLAHCARKGANTEMLRRLARLGERFATSCGKILIRDLIGIYATQTHEGRPCRLPGRRICQSTDLHA